MTYKPVFMIVAGLPSVGKTTLVNKLRNAGLDGVYYDQEARALEYWEDQWAYSNSEKYELSYDFKVTEGCNFLFEGDVQQLADAAWQGRNIIIDSPFTTVQKVREGFLKASTTFHTNICVHIQVPENVRQATLRRSQQKFDDRRLKKYNSYPQLEEGFDLITSKRKVLEALNGISS